MTQNISGRLVCLALLVMLNAGPALAQSRRADSLQRILSHTPKGDTVWYRTLTFLAEHYRGSKPDSVIFYGNKVLTAPETDRFFRFKAGAYNAIGYSYYNTGAFTPALDAFRSFYKYAAKTGDRPNMANAINNEGNVYIELGDYATALERYRQALALRRAAGDVKGVALSYNNIGFIYKDLGDFDQAVSNFLIAMRGLEQTGDKVAIANNYNMLGVVYGRKKDYALAITYLERALTTHRDAGNNNGAGISLQILANIYGEQGLYDKSLAYNIQVQELYKSLGDQRQLAIVAANIGEVYSRQGKYAASVPMYQEAIALSQKIGYRRSLANLWMGLAQSYINLGELPQARVLLDSATGLIAQTKNKEYLRSLYELEAKYNAATGNYKDALEYAFRFTAQKDTLLNEANIKAMSDMSVKYETEKKQARIVLLGKESAIQELQLKNQRLQLDEQLFHLAQDKLALSEADLKIANSTLQIKTQNEIILSQKLQASERAKRLDSLSRMSELQRLELRNQDLEVQRRNAVIGGLAGLMLLAGLLGVSYYRRSQLKAEARMHTAILRQQEEATRAVLEAEEAERTRIAKDLHDGVGQMMSAAKMNLSAYEDDTQFKTKEDRDAFERIIGLVDASCREVRAVSHNMMPNALLKNSLAAAIREFINQLDQRRLKVHLYTEGLDQRLDANTETVLYRVIQECVNNVIKHSGADTLDISLIKEPGEITATIEDNGHGFDTGTGYEGIGLKNIRTRVDYLRGSVDFDSAPGRGTLVAIHVPLVHSPAANI